jgi:hypothetical protein
MTTDDTSEDEQTPTDPETAIDRELTARLLGCAVPTLDRWRYRAEGPPFFRPNGRTIRYRLGDVLAYRDARTVGKVAAR